jgi:hypothetical protein
MIYAIILKILASKFETMDMQNIFLNDPKLKSIMVELYKINYIVLFHKLCENGYHFDFSQVKRLQKITSKYVSKFSEKTCLRPREQPRPKLKYNDEKEIEFVISTMNIKPKQAYQKYLEIGFKRKKQAFNMLRYWVRDNIFF